MRTEAGWLASALLALSCASAPPRRDLSRVEDAARVPLPVAALASKPDGRTGAEVSGMLARPLTPDSAVRVAMLNNRELRAALRDVAVALYVGGRDTGESATAYFARATDDATAVLALLCELRAEEARPDDFIEPGFATPFAPESSSGECAA